MPAWLGPRPICSPMTTSSGGLHATGLLPAQHLRALIEQSREIQSLVPIEPEQLQPASLDLRLGATAYRVRASFLPGEAATVQDKIGAFAMHRFELSEAGAVLEKGCVYIVELMERLALRKRTSAIANPKGSIGRIDVFVHRGRPPVSSESRGQTGRCHHNIGLREHSDKIHVWIWAKYSKSFTFSTCNPKNEAVSIHQPLRRIGSGLGEAGGTSDRGAGGVC